jgi:hypothetical protein
VHKIHRECTKSSVIFSCAVSLHRVAAPLLLRRCCCAVVAALSFLHRRCGSVVALPLLLHVVAAPYLLSRFCCAVVAVPLCIYVYSFLNFMAVAVSVILTFAVSVAVAVDDAVAATVDVL